MRFVDVTNDVAFRKIFGNEQKTGPVISFLNAVLALEGDRRIQTVTIVNPWQAPRLKGEKSTVIDVRAVDQANRQFVVEMQVADAKGFAKRVQYYTARDYSMQINSGDDYPLLNPTYFVGILDFLFTKGSEYLTHHLILDEKTGEHLLTNMHFSFIELRKFNKQEHELVTPVEKWIYFIKNAENLDIIPENVDDQGLLEAYKEADKHNWKKEDYIDYDNAAIARQDQIGAMELAVERAEAKGEASGSQRREREIVIGLWQHGAPLDLIAKSTNLSVEEVRRIIAKHEGKA